jgi:hypothetical protein
LAFKVRQLNNEGISLLLKFRFFILDDIDK